MTDDRPKGAQLVTSEEALAEIYGDANPRSVSKETDRLTPHYRTFVERSPFAILASCGPEGLDCSPRGDAAGFVRIESDRSLLLPDRSGNNRIDTLRNIVRDPRVALLFLVPGIGESLRVNGTGEIDADPALCASFVDFGKAPRTVLRIRIESVYFQCRKALVRSHLWAPESQIDRKVMPSAGQMLASTGSVFDGDSYDREQIGKTRKDFA